MLLLGQLNKLTKRQLVERIVQLQAEAKTAPTIGGLYGGDPKTGDACGGDGYIRLREAIVEWNDYSGDTRPVEPNDTAVWVIGKLSKAVSRLLDDVSELDAENARTSKRYQQAWDQQREAEDLCTKYERSISLLVLQLHEQAERLQKYHKASAKEDRNV